MGMSNDNALPSPDQIALWKDALARCERQAASYPNHPDVAAFYLMRVAYLKKLLGESK